MFEVDVFIYFIKLINFNILLIFVVMDIVIEVCLVIVMV